MRDDRCLETLQLRSRFQAQLLTQDGARRLVGPERIGLATRTVQRQHLLSPQTLAQRMLRSHRGQLGRDLVVSTQS